jgi:hypothetical protein
MVPAVRPLRSLSTARGWPGLTPDPIQKNRLSRSRRGPSRRVRKNVSTRPGSKAEVATSLRHVRSTPESRHEADGLGCPFCANNGSPASFDHLVDTSEKSRRNVKAECLSSLEIDNEFELGLQLDREIGGFFTPENSIHVASCPTIGIGDAHAIANHSSNVDKFAESVDRWKPKAIGSIDDDLAIREHKRIIQNNKEVGIRLRHRRQCVP